MSQQALFDLGLDLDNPFKPSFAVMMGEADAHVLVILAPPRPSAVAVADPDERLGAVDQAVGIITYDADGNVLSLNERAQSAMEDYAEELVGRNLDRIWPKEFCDSEAYIAFWEKLRRGSPVEGRHKHLTAVESEVWFQSCFAPVRDASGHLVKVVQTLLDVTQDTYAAKTALERANAMWESALFCEFDAEGHVTAMNPVMAQVLGYEADDCIGKQGHFFCDKEYARSLAYKKIWEELRDGRVQYELVHQRTKANKSVWLRATLVPVKDASGRVVKVLKLARNATETHEALNDSSTLVTAMDRLVGRIELDEHLRVTRVNKGFEVAFKAPAADVMGREFKDFCTAEFANSALYRDFFDKLRSGDSIEDQFELRRADGEAIWIRGAYVPLFSQSGALWKIVLSFVNITPLVTREAETRSRIQGVDKGQFMIEYDLEGKILSANAKFVDASGFLVTRWSGNRTRCSAPTMPPCWTRRARSSRSAATATAKAGSTAAAPPTAA